MSVHCWIRVIPYTLNDILQDGRFKSRFEAASCASYDDLDMRAKVENVHYGYALNLPDAERPIYGYLCANENGNATHGHLILEEYGTAAIRLKDHVKSRTTFVIGDSLFGSVMPTPLRDEALPSDIDSIIPYVEAAYHGGVSISDIEEIVFLLDRVPASIEKLVDVLGNYGISSRIQIVE